MKKILKSRIFIFVLGFIVACAIGVYAIGANEITYNETTVDLALDDLYSRLPNSNVSVLYTRTYGGDGVSFSYTLTDDYKDVYVQGDCRAADTNIYVNVTSPAATFTKEYDTGIGGAMDGSWDRTYVYHGSNLSNGTVINVSARYKGTVVIYGIK